MAGDSVKEARELASFFAFELDEEAGPVVLDLAEFGERVILSLDEANAISNALHTLADELENARRELGELGQTLLARDKALEASYHELTALRAECERLTRRDRDVHDMERWAATKALRSKYSRHDVFVGGLAPVDREWLNENYPEAKRE